MRAPFLRFILILPIAVVPLVWALWLAHAANRTWNGNGGNDLWTTAANWNGLVAPSAGDDLIFPTSNQRNSVNKFALGTAFNSISVSGGHSMTGNSISLNSGITAGGGVIDLSSIKLNNNQTFNAPTAGTGAVIDSAIDNNGKNLTLNGPGVFTINGSISSAGNLIKNGTGKTVLTGNNPSYTGVTLVFNGSLLVFGSQPNSNVVISGGTLGGSGTVGELTFGLQGGSISPAAANNGTGILTVNGNATFPGTALGILEVDLNSPTLGSGYDQLEVNGTVNLGSGSPGSDLRVNLGFAPQPGTTFTIIDNDGTDAVTGQFANLPEGSTFTVNNGTAFRITYQGGTNANDVVLTVVSGELSFTASSFTAQEGVGAANITLSRTGGGNTTAVAKITLADVTTNPADYRFTPGALDTSFNPGSGANAEVLTTALQANNKIIIGGVFTTYNGTSSNKLARLNPDGSLDATFDIGSGPSSNVLTLIVQPDGKIIVGGTFISYNNTPRNFIARLNTNGSLDTTFDPGSSANSSVLTTALQADGKIIIGGFFTKSIARLNANGSVDTTFAPVSGANDSVNTIAIQQDGKIIICGNFSLYNGIARNRIARLNADGSLDSNFDPGSGANNSLFATVLQSDGKIIVGGVFTTFNSVARNRIARLNAGGSLDTTFNPGSGPNGQVNTIAVQPDGKIIIGGNFFNYNGTPRNNIARLNSDGSLDTTFIPGSGANVLAHTTALQPDGKIILGGILDQRIARIDGDLFATWGPNDFTNKTVTLPLVSDGLVEGNETLNLALLPFLNAVAGTPSSATLTITEPIVRTWNGAGTTNNWAEGANWNGGGVPGAGDDLVFPLVAARLSNFNDFPINTTFNSLTISGGGYTLNGNALRLISNLVNDNQSTNLVNNTVSLVINGQGGVITSSLNTNLSLILSSNNTYSGTTTINSGHLVVRGIQPTSAVVINNGSLEGDGVVGPVSLNGGSVRPGLINIPISSVLSLRGDLVFSSAARFAPTLMNDATNQLQTNTVRVNGTVALNDAGLFMVVIHSPNPPAISPGMSITLIDNDGTDAVDGKFFGFPEGSVLTISGQQLQLSYVGGDGNDVVLTALTVPVPTIQFTNLTFPVSESDGSVTLTVTRTNDTSSSASVDFHTIDTDTFTVGCFDTVNNQGGAFGRCDFATVVGTLQFGPGEANKTITVPIIDDAFVEGAETFKVVFENPVGAFMGNIPAATVTIQSNDTAGLPNPIFQSPFFVRQHYLDFLSREPDAAGFNAWVNLLNGCPDVNNLDPNAPSAGCDRIIVSQSFFGSQEFQLKGFYVFRFYKLAFNRLPEYLEIISDMSFVAGTTAQEVFQRKAQLAVKFTQRPEFQTAFGGLTNAAYVNALLSRYQLTQITTLDPQQPDGTQKVTLTAADLTNQLNNATLTRAQVLRAIADSDQVTTAELQNAFVATQYYGYLRRKPDDAGFNAWLGVLQTGDVRTMINGFMNSQEYRLRFGPQ